MDVFFRPDGVLNYDPFYDIRMPYFGPYPPPGYTLYQDSIVHVRLNSGQLLPPPLYNLYF